MSFWYPNVWRRVKKEDSKENHKSYISQKIFFCAIYLKMDLCSSRMSMSCKIRKAEELIEIKGDIITKCNMPFLSESCHGGKMQKNPYIGWVKKIGIRTVD